MADLRPGGHKRSKSSLALSLLHRDRSKNDDRGDPTSPAASDAGSPPGSPITSQEGPSALRPGDRTGATSSKVTSEPMTPDLTIQQSVKMFRLFEVLRSGDRAAIGKAIKENSQSASSGQALKGTTILHLATQCAEPPVVEQILSAMTADPTVRVELNAQDREGNTPLHLGSLLGRAAVVQLLLAQPSVDITVINYQGRSPIDLARTPEIFQQLQLARALFTENQVHAVHQLVARQDLDGLEKLLEESYVAAVLDVNGVELATDPSTVETAGTLLHEAARKKDVRLIQLLLLHGADPFRRDRQGKLPQDVTKDDRTRAILKKSPAAAAAQRGIQEKAILGTSLAENALSKRESREMKGYLKKWTNYTSGYKLRWFVLEDGVLSYYKHQDDAGSACRGAMNMRIAKLSMDAQDKSRFEIQGKSSVKYHLKANHTVEAKRWFWALNNAIQWAKDEARQEESRKQRGPEQVNQPHGGRGDLSSDTYGASSGTELSKVSGKGLVPATALSVPSNNASRVSFRSTGMGSSSVMGDDHGSAHGSFDAVVNTEDMARLANTATLAGDMDDDEEYGDDASSREAQPTSKDAFNITAHSANLQLGLLSQVSNALKTQTAKKPETSIADPVIKEAMDTYEGAVQSLQTMVSDLLRIARDRDAYWQYRLEREADMRRLWEDSMAKVAREQEELEGRIGESEEKRKRTKRALRDALDGEVLDEDRYQSDDRPTFTERQPSPAGQNVPNADVPIRRKSILSPGLRRKSTIAAFTDLSDSDSDEDEEFFDAVGAGEVAIVSAMPISSPAQSHFPVPDATLGKGTREMKAVDLASSFKGYEDPIRKRLKMDADNRPKISLWGILKSMIGKDMTKMTLPVSFNEPTSLLQRVAEDMEYTDLLDIAADRVDPTERMVYVAAFAASEYASTIGRVAKPFNPLLGETYEYARPDKGYRFFIEQVSHHPPIGAAWAESPKWDYYGESAVKSKFYGKSFDINPLGTWFLKLRPISGGEELYTWKKVTSSVIGIITGNPTVDNYGLMEIKNWTTGEVCTLNFKPRGWTASSAYQVNGKVLAADGKTIWSMGGRWNDKIYARLTPGFESTIEPGPTNRVHEPGSSQVFLVWESNKRPTGIPFNLTPFVVTLNALPAKLQPLLPPTDTRLRPDQRAMEDGLYDLAATEKNRVEEKQRAKRREREAKGEEFVPRWFSKGKCIVTGEEYWVSNGEYWKSREGVGRGRKWDSVEDIF